MINMEENVIGESSENVEEIIAEEVDPSSSSIGPQLIISFASSFLVQYGWFLLLGSLAAYFIWNKYLQSEWKKWREKCDQEAESAHYHKDPDLALARIQAMENARQKMQEQYNVAANRYVEKMMEKEEARRLEKIADWDRHQKGLGYCNKTRVQEREETSKGTASKSKPKVKSNDYNPLMGSSNGSFRPQKRSACGGGGGGCGGGGGGGGCG